MTNTDKFAPLTAGEIYLYDLENLPVAEDEDGEELYASDMYGLPDTFADAIYNKTHGIRQ
ncbi:hypothetical protein CRD59_06970 [Bifidobacterium xylocopae]|uniref:Uncharacterized protein n=2 Tax=Bifidobacterium xylocopae TaxID=2493119 RepID=A0A366KAS2_9BIFI|nr:hypothetical protein CRD59_06970 [Bifidobacterium xylocopae]